VIPKAVGRRERRPAPGASGSGHHGRGRSALCGNRMNGRGMRRAGLSRCHWLQKRDALPVHAGNDCRRNVAIARARRLAQLADLAALSLDALMGTPAPTRAFWARRMPDCIGRASPSAYSRIRDSRVAPRALFARQDAWPALTAGDGNTQVLAQWRCKQKAGWLRITPCSHSPPKRKRRSLLGISRGAAGL
jgi:hypothetical protein